MRWLWLLVPLLSGCADAVWVPQVGLPWWQANELPADRVEGDCTVGFDAVVLGLPGVALMDEEAWATPGQQALDLTVGLSTLGEVRVPAAGAYESVELELGAVGPGDGSAAAGSATPAQRARIQAGGFVVGWVSCGEERADFELAVPEGQVICPTSTELEITAQASFSTLSIFDAGALLGEDPLDGAALLAGPIESVGADGAWRNGDGTPCLLAP